MACRKLIHRICAELPQSDPYFLWSISCRPAQVNVSTPGSLLPMTLRRRSFFSNSSAIGSAFAPEARKRCRPRSGSPPTTLGLAVVSSETVWWWAQSVANLSPPISLLNGETTGWGLFTRTSPSIWRGPASRKPVTRVARRNPNVYALRVASPIVPRKRAKRRKSAKIFKGTIVNLARTQAMPQGRIPAVGRA